ncbi:MAG: hypothetical protein JST84_05205 [Acidobacteria bacterium]|nr:hypothetical protein [Acidobacteriota bacterium]
MSRYHVPQSDVSVGWDNPLQTYFLQIFDEDEDLAFEVGGQPREVKTIEALEAIASQHNIDLSRYRDQLIRDKANAAPLNYYQLKNLHFLEKLNSDA